MQRSGANVQKKTMKTEVVEDITVKSELRQRGPIVQQKISGSVNTIKTIIHPEGTLKNGLKMLWRQAWQNDRHVEEHEIDAIFSSGFQSSIPNDTNLATEKQKRGMETQKKPKVDETDAVLIREFQATKIHISMSNARTPGGRNSWLPKPKKTFPALRNSAASLSGGGGHSKRSN